MSEKKDETEVIEIENTHAHGVEFVGILVNKEDKMIGFQFEEPITFFGMDVPTANEIIKAMQIALQEMMDS